MEIREAIRSRKSIRGYKPDPVSREVIREILEIACRAPSVMNTQPWEFLVLGGEALRRVREKNLECLKSGEPAGPEHAVVGWPRDSVYRTRQVALAKQLFQLMEISRDDRARRLEWMSRGFLFFGAPAAVIVVTDRALSGHGPLLDIGAVLQNICLAALAYGLGTCIEDQGVLYPQVLREATGLPESKRIVMAVSLGYPDGAFPANRIDTAREPVDRITTWLGFGEDESGK